MENKKKAKGTVLSLVLSILLVLNLVVCGVAIALSVANVTLGGSITFNAKHVNATISAGQVTGGTLNGTNKMQAITLDATHDGATEIATWSGLDLEFNESGDDVTISFTITNNSEEYALKSALTTTAGTQDNATMTVSAEKIEIVNEGTPTYTTLTDLSNVIIAKYDADTKTQTCVAYTITFKVENKDKSASISDFALSFDLEKFAGYTVTLNAGYEDMGGGSNNYSTGQKYISYYAVDGGTEAIKYTSGTEIKAYEKIWISTTEKTPDWTLTANNLYGDGNVGDSGINITTYLQVNDRKSFDSVGQSNDVWAVITITSDTTIALAGTSDVPGNS